MNARTRAQAHARAEDARFMALALALGRRGLGRTWPNPAVGTVIVKDGVVVGRGWTQAGGRPHAESEALRRAGGAARGATLYVTLEPCSHHGRSPPCADAIIAAGLSRVVSPLEDPNPEVAGRGYARLRAAGITVDVGVGETEARHDHAGHIRRMRDARPHVILKLAISADGKAGAPSRLPVAITGEAVRERVHLMRAQSDAVAIGVGTAFADDPLLTCRLPGMGGNSPVRIVFDSKLRLPLDSRLVRSVREVPVWVAAGATAPRAAEETLLRAGVVVMRIEEKDGRLDLPAALKMIASRGITRLMLEGGPTLAATFIAADLVDEAILFHSSKMVGGDGVDAFAGPTQIALARRLSRATIELVGADRCEIFQQR